MALEIDWVIIDCIDLEAMSDFWCRALDFEHVWTGPSGGYLLAAKDGSHLRLGLMPCQDGKTAKNRLHLDLRPDDQEAEVRRLEDLGAQRIDIGQCGVPWVVMADPEGNEFCVLRSRSQEQLARHNREN
jgi:predicted enzyme related to lactoylglutathione lyase